MDGGEWSSGPGRFACSKQPQYPLSTRLGGSKSQLKSLAATGNRTPDRPARNLVTIHTTSSQPSFWHSWQFVLRTRHISRHCVTCEVYEIPLSTPRIMVSGRTSFVYVPVQLSRWLLLLPGSSTPPSLDAVLWLKPGARLQIQIQSVWGMWWTQVQRRLVKVVGVFPVSVISPALHTHPFHLSIISAVWSRQFAASWN